MYYHRKEQICKSIKVKQSAFEPILSIDEDEIEEIRNNPNRGTAKIMAIYDHETGKLKTRRKRL